MHVLGERSDWENIRRPLSLDKMGKPLMCQSNWAINKNHADINMGQVVVLIVVATCGQMFEAIPQYPYVAMLCRRLRFIERIAGFVLVEQFWDCEWIQHNHAQCSCFLHMQWDIMKVIPGCMTLIIHA